MAKSLKKLLTIDKVLKLNTTIQTGRARANNALNFIFKQFMIVVMGVIFVYCIHCGKQEIFVLGHRDEEGSERDQSVK